MFIKEVSCIEFPAELKRKLLYGTAEPIRFNIIA
jgi:hypothetical protein